MLVTGLTTQAVFDARFASVETLQNVTSRLKTKLVQRREYCTHSDTGCAISNYPCTKCSLDILFAVSSRSRTVSGMRPENARLVAMARYFSRVVLA